VPPVHGAPPRAPRFRLRLAPALALLALIAAPAAAHAQATWHLSTDNDYFNFWTPPEERDDLNYSYGAEITRHDTRPPRWLAHLTPGAWRDTAGGTLRSTMSLRQEAYMPSSVYDDYPGDRPFAGWLEVEVGLVQESDARVRRLSLHAGVTGSPSLAERTLTWFHHTFGFGEREWTRRIPSEPGAFLEWREASLPLARAGGDGWRIAAGPEWRLRLGTMHVDARGGAAFTAGLRPAPPWRASDAPSPWRTSLYVTGAARLDAIARDAFLDGALFHDGPHVSARVFVPEAEIGIGAHVGHVRLEWRTIRRGKVFDRQVAPHSYSTLALSVVGGP